MNQQQEERLNKQHLENHKYYQLEPFQNKTEHLNASVNYRQPKLKIGQFYSRQSQDEQEGLNYLQDNIHQQQKHNQNQEYLNQNQEDQSVALKPVQKINKKNRFIFMTVFCIICVMSILNNLNKTQQNPKANNIQINNKNKNVLQKNQVKQQKILTQFQIPKHQSIQHQEIKKKDKQQTQNKNTQSFKYEQKQLQNLNQKKQTQNSNIEQLKYNKQKKVLTQIPLHRITKQQLLNAADFLKLNDKPIDISKIKYFQNQLNHQNQQKHLNLEEGKNIIQIQIQTQTQTEVQQIQNLLNKQYAYYQSKYHISKFDTEIQFCIIIPSFNNVKFFQRNLNSILNQEYNNFKVVYIDDASIDKTVQKVQKYIQNWNQNNKDLQRNFFIIKNQLNQGRVKNVHDNAKNYCQKGEIMMVIDGDDQLVGRQVFQLINTIYQSKNIKGLYTQSIIFHGKTPQVGHSQPYDQKVVHQNTFRDQGFVCSHLRTYLSDLYFQIKEADLKDENGIWINAAGDLAQMFPILQMGGQSIMYLNEVVYKYNDITLQNDHYLHAQNQQKMEQYIRKKQKYKPIQQNSLLNKFQLKKKKVEDS